MKKVVLRKVFGCLNCDKPIPMSEAITGKTICSIKCLKALNRLGGQFDKLEVWKRGGSDGKRD